MKKTLPLLLILLLCAFGTVQAQVVAPAPSPASKLMQVVGLTDVTVEYSRPSMKGRDIFGALVPWNEVWRLGANSATKVTFSTDVNLGGVDLAAGSYALLATPGQPTWTIHVYEHTGNGNWTSYPEGEAKAQTFTVDAATISENIESFMIGFDMLRNDGAMMHFIWADQYVGVELKVPTDKAVLDSIKKTMSGPSSGDYYDAAVYYRESGKDLNKALAWMDKSISLDAESDKYWVYRQKSLIHADLGDVAGAVAAAKKSLELATAAGNTDYIKLNTTSLSGWGE